MKPLKFLIALLLLPALGSSLHFAVNFLADATAKQNWPWMQAGWFGFGFLLWLIAYFTLPRPNQLYILGHELTHVLAVWLSGGKVSGLKIQKNKGRVTADRTSFLITLAPYVFPLYPFLFGAVWAVLFWLVPEVRSGQGWRDGFLFLWSVVWSFHMTFTLSVMKTEQSDFASQGYLFSFVLIFLCNLWILILLLWMGLGVYQPMEGFLKMWHILIQDYARIGGWLGEGIQQVFEKIF